MPQIMGIRKWVVSEPAVFGWQVRESRQSPLMTVLRTDLSHLVGWEADNDMAGPIRR